MNKTMTAHLSRCAFFALSALLTACGLTGPFPGVPDFVNASSIPVYKGPVAAPQVAYRIDENRYFEIVPKNKYACADADLFYVDKARGIRGSIYRWQPGYNLRSDFIIDAANEKYLVAPIYEGSQGRSSGGEQRAIPSLPYSSDWGRTWRLVVTGSSGGYKIHTNERQIYTSGMSADLNLLGSKDVIWSDGLLSDFPPPRKSPIDKKFHCDGNEKG